MDEELLKRNTDCVYFLASPLTCKKGIDCEYRHCEMARLNPRECWYWLAGNCLNPTCAFRHPPLDAHAGALSESALSSVPVNKTPFPCYFYFKGFCNKGDGCSYLHSVNADAPAGKSIKSTLASSDVLPIENKPSAGSDSGSGKTNAHLSPAENTKVDTKVQPEEDFPISVLENVPEQSESTQISVSEDEETAALEPDSFLPVGGLVENLSYVCEEHSSGEEEDDQIDPEERWESSPGFDVLADGNVENLDGEDDPEYIMALDRGRRELNRHFLGYDLESPIEYDLEYPDAELHYEREIYDPYNHQVDAHFFGNARNIPGRAKVKMLDSILSHKRKLISMELALDDQDEMDLRDRLRRQRIIDNHSVSGFSRRHESRKLIGRSQERPWRHGMVHRQQGGRLAPEVGRNTFESLRKNGTSANGGSQHVLRRQLQRDISRRHRKEKRRSLSSEVSRKLVPRGRRSTQVSTTFSGPKSLAQIKQEKRKAEESDDPIWKRGCSHRIDFEGPKPLSEILKDKKKPTSDGEGNSNTN